MLDLIGRTPLVRLPQFERETPGVELYAKAEWQNPGGSVKDRAAARMIADGEASGRLRPGLTIVDATSGNTGIAYAMVGAARGYKVKLFLPENASPERKLILRAFGAELVLTNPLEGTDGAIREVRRMVAERSGPVLLSGSVQQRRQLARAFRYDRRRKSSSRPAAASRTSSPASAPAARSSAPSRALRQFNPAIKLISFQPDSPFHGLEGLKHMAIGHGAGDLRRRRWPTRISRVSTEDAHSLVRRLAREEGLLVGISSGAALAATLQVARGLERGVVVTVFPDGAEKYLSESFWTAEE